MRDKTKQTTRSILKKFLKIDVGLNIVAIVLIISVVITRAEIHPRLEALIIVLLISILMKVQDELLKDKYISKVKMLRPLTKKEE